MKIKVSRDRLVKKKGNISSSSKLKEYNLTKSQSSKLSNALLDANKKTDKKVLWWTFLICEKGENMKRLQKLHKLMCINNTNRVIARENSISDDKLSKNITFKLDTGQNIATYIEDILGYEFEYQGNVVDGLGSDESWWVVHQLNQIYLQELGMSEKTINEDIIREESIVQWEI